ncbi:choline dehydrogenase, mitochondrial-like [Convolutriloba macropyga]|uniref:choline dehydrogenase, mitochondrial-like n=1 Tax=Convolutriloba macropyga TaxID=536237 RepID=UPI003F528E0E
MPFVDSADESYDYIIVGAGASGCVVANRLSRTNKTLLIEAGGLDSSWEILMPQHCGLNWGDERFSWPIVTTPQVNLKDSKSTVAYLGRVLGGSASINTMCWMRGHYSDYDSWASLGVEGWNWREVAPYFKRVEGCTFKCNTDIRGTSGPMKLTKPKEKSHFVSAVLKAAEQMGYPLTDDINCGQMEGFTTIESQTHKGVRHSPSQGYLHPVLSRENLHVLCKTQVAKVTVEGSHATGVDFVDGQTGKLALVRASKEVILCGSAIFSPKILLLSGIGPKQELEALGIESVRNLPGVGKNLQVPILIPVASVNKSDNYYYGMYPNSKKEMAQRDWFVNHTGPHTSLGLDVAAIVKTDNKLMRPNANFMFVDSLFGPFPGGNMFQKDHSEAPGYLCGVSNTQCFSKGSVTLQNSDPKTDPLVDFGMLSDNRDVQNAIDGVKVVRQIFEHEALSDDVQTIILPPPDVQTDQQLEGFVREFVGSHGYYSGTCKMGSYSDSMAVTDNQGRVWGVGNLRVVDSSIIPDAPSGPLVSVCTMMAEKISDKITEAQHQF